MNSPDEPASQPVDTSLTPKWRRIWFAAGILVASLGACFVLLGSLQNAERAEKDARNFQDGSESPSQTSTGVDDSEAWQPVVLTAQPQLKSAVDVNTVETRPRRVATITTISGVTRDDSGRPIPGVTVWLMSLFNHQRLSGSVTSNAAGRFEIQDAVLEMLPSSTGQKYAIFELLATARNFGVTWHPMTHVIDGPRPKAPFEFSGTYVLPDSRECYFNNEPIEITLEMARSATLEGQVLSDTGRPLAEAEVQVSELRMRKHLDIPTSFSGYKLSSTSRLPEQLRVARTDATGHFRIEGLPREAIVGLSIKHPSFVTGARIVTTSLDPLREVTVLPNRQTRDASGRLVGNQLTSQLQVESSPLEIILRQHRAVSLQVQTPDSKNALNDLVVNVIGPPDNGTVWEYLKTRNSLDARLLPGTYSVTVSPMVDSGYVVTRREFEVTTAFDTQVREIEVDRAAIVDFEVVDADTGAGIPNIQFWMTRRSGDDKSDVLRRNPNAPPGRMQVQSQIYHPGISKTDQNGRLRVSLRPSSQHFEVDAVQEYSVIKLPPDEVQLQAGETTKLRFELRKRETTAQLIRSRHLNLDDRPKWLDVRVRSDRC